MCHRQHTSASGIQTGIGAEGTRTNALTVGNTGTETGDAELCYACHGVDTLGSSKAVQSEFMSGPGHSLAPTESAFGPSEKQCSDCHDSHGAEKRADDTPYPALLRARLPAGGFAYSGDAYCGSCHVVRAASEFPGVAVWRKTAHASIATPTTGTDIVCSACHTPHGSPIAPNIVTEVATPAVAVPTTVPANDRRFCETCHSAPARTWEGTSTYALSSHGSAAATVPVKAEWASEETSRPAGECQSCHAAMGASDGEGGAVPRLAAKAGAALCYDCHKSGGAANADIKSLAYRPAAVVSAVIAYDSSPGTAQLGDMHVFTRDTTSSPTISGPRSFLSGRTGAIAAGDVEGNGSTQLVVGRTGTSRVTVLSQSRFAGLAEVPGSRTLLAPAEYLAIADVLDDAYGRAELITASGSTVRVYRWNTLGASFDSVAALSLPGEITGLAAGDIVSGSHADIAVTTNGPDELAILTQDTPTSLVVSGSYPARSLPRGPSARDINNDGHAEIAVANAGELSPTLSVYSGTGAEIMSGGSTVDASPTAAVIGDILPGLTEPGTSGDEIVLALQASSGADRLEAFARDGTGLAAPLAYAFAAFSGPDSLAVGDVDGDARSELLVGLGGRRTSTPATSRPPGLAIIHASTDGTSLGTIDERSGGGLELAGTANVLAADFGAIGPSRHPVEAAQGAHISTETAPFAEHVACADCHNVHAATSAQVLAPQLPGPLVGAWGVNVSGAMPVLKTGVTAEYELCFKCHADYDGWTPLSGVRTVDAEFDTGNASFHPVEGVSPSTNATGQVLVEGLAPNARLNCSDCHGNSKSRGLSGTGQPNGPHASPSAPLLERPLIGASSEDTGTLCYGCHPYATYGDGSADGQPTRSSGFVDDGADLKLHAAHSTRGFSCATCHVSHGSQSMPYGLRDDLGWAAETDGGRCSNGCHGGAGKAYQR
jgi:predicted CXXCH cytochrome family protein